MQDAARSRHMTALLVSELCADRLEHLTLDSRKYSSAFLRTPGSARPRRGARRRTSSDAMAGRNARRTDCQSAKARPRRMQIG